jgi:hypothetical protein
MEAVVVLPLVQILGQAQSMMVEEIAEGFLHIRLEDLHSLLCGIRCMLLLPQMDKANGTLCLWPAPAGWLILLLPQNRTKDTLNTHEVPHLPQAPCQQSQRKEKTVGGHEENYFLSEPKLNNFYLLSMIFFFITSNLTTSRSIYEQRPISSFI